MTSLETHYSSLDIETRILKGLKEAGLDTNQRLTPSDFAALDHFHTGGLKASRELLDKIRIDSGSRVLDIGAGLGGAARMIASELGCGVDCIEMSADYCRGAELLNKLTGLSEQIGVHRGSALELPFDDQTFDVVWMQNVGMNIEDKSGLYDEIFRVLKPGGCFAFQEMAAGELPPSYFPLPWAGVPADNHLITGDVMNELLQRSGFSVELFEDTSDAHLGGATTNATPSPSGNLGLGVFVDNLAEKAGNARKSLEEGRVRLVRGVFRSP